MVCQAMEVERPAPRDEFEVGWRDSDRRILAPWPLLRGGPADQAPRQRGRRSMVLESPIASSTPGASKTPTGA